MCVGCAHVERGGEGRGAHVQRGGGGGMLKRGRGLLYVVVQEMSPSQLHVASVTPASTPPLKPTPTPTSTPASTPRPCGLLCACAGGG